MNSLDRSEDSDKEHGGKNMFVVVPILSNSSTPLTDGTLTFTSWSSLRLCLLRLFASTGNAYLPVRLWIFDASRSDRQSGIAQSTVPSSICLLLCSNKQVIHFKIDVCSPFSVTGPEYQLIRSVMLSHVKNAAFEAGILIHLQIWISGPSSTPLKRSRSRKEHHQNQIQKQTSAE